MGSCFIADGSSARSMDVVIAISMGPLGVTDQAGKTPTHEQSPQKPTHLFHRRVLASTYTCIMNEVQPIRMMGDDVISNALRVYVAAPA